MNPTPSSNTPRNQKIDAAFINAQIDPQYNGYGTYAQAFIEVIRPYRIDDDTAIGLYHKARHLAREQQRIIRRPRPYHHSPALRKAS